MVKFQQDPNPCNKVLSVDTFDIPNQDKRLAIYEKEGCRFTGPFSGLKNEI